MGPIDPGLKRRAARVRWASEPPRPVARRAPRALCFLATRLVLLGCLLPGTARGEASAPDCAAWEATYAVSATLRITDTPMGAGDGVHRVGPGTMVLRFDDEDGAQPGHVELRSFDLVQHFAVEPSGAFFSATIVTQADARVTPDASGAAARGTVVGDLLRWAGPVLGYRTDGAIGCTGSLCGKFGAPPPGRSEIHGAPHAVQFQSLRFHASGATFQMPYALVSQDAAPRQRTFLSLEGRATSWVCLRPRRRNLSR